MFHSLLYVVYIASCSSQFCTFRHMTSGGLFLFPKRHYPVYIFQELLSCLGLVTYYKFSSPDCQILVRYYTLISCHHWEHSPSHIQWKYFATLFCRMISRILHWGVKNSSTRIELFWPMCPAVLAQNKSFFFFNRPNIVHHPTYLKIPTWENDSSTSIRSAANLAWIKSSSKVIFFVRLNISVSFRTDCRTTIFQ